MLLSSSEFSDKLEQTLKNSTERIIVLSAFTKLAALTWLFDHAGAEDVSIISRWQPSDLTCGASDFECYEFCRDRGIRFGISLNLHGKVYCVDDQILVGSANLTSKGMALSPNHNQEFGIGFTGQQADTEKIDNFLREVTWLDDTLADSMRSDLDMIEKKNLSNGANWSASVLANLQARVTHLWAHELPFNTLEELMRFDAENEGHLHDLDLLGLNSEDISSDRLLSAYRKTNAFHWLLDLVESEGSLSFGGVTARLHNAILDDPTPYRQEVKSLVSTLLEWAAQYPDCYSISRPGYSTVIQRA